MIESAEITTVSNESDKIKFGGVVWTRHEDGRIEAFVKGTGRFSIIQCDEKNEDASYFGKWHWGVFFDNYGCKWEVLSGENKPKLIDTYCGGFADTMQEAAQFCLNAKQDFIQDIQRISHALRIENVIHATDCCGCFRDKVKIEVLSSVIGHLTDMLPNPASKV